MKNHLTELEADGLLSVKNAPIGSISYQADYFARQHPAESNDVNDFHALTRRYYAKIMRVNYPESYEDWLEHERRRAEYSSFFAPMGRYIHLQGKLC